MPGFGGVVTVGTTCSSYEPYNYNTRGVEKTTKGVNTSLKSLRMRDSKGNIEITKFSP